MTNIGKTSITRRIRPRLVTGRLRDSAMLKGTSGVRWSTDMWCRRLCDANGFRVWMF